MKKNILFYGDSPLAPTGFGQVTKNIVEALSDKFNFEIVGLNHAGQEYDRDKYFIHDVTGDQTNGIDLYRQLIRKGDYDILFTVYNHETLFHYIQYVDKNKPYIHYSPFDMSVELPTFEMYKRTVGTRVYYNQYSKDLLKDESGIVIPHGTYPDLFQRVKREEKSKLRQDYEIGPDTFVVLNVNHNQWRKDFGSSVIAFCEFAKEIPDSMYIIHANIEDMGGNLLQQIELLKNKYNPKAKILISEKNRWAFSLEELVKLYQISDCFLTTSMGEGWGLTTTEALCCGLPVIAPKNTSFLDILGEGRGLLCDIDRYIIPYANSNYPYPIVKIDDVVKQLNIVYNKVGRPNARIYETDHSMLLRTYCEKLRWENVQKQWKKLFNQYI